MKNKFNGLSSILTILMCTYLLSCSLSKGDISGNIYLTMKSGDIKKAAGIKVMLLEDKDGLLSEQVKEVQLKHLNSLNELSAALSSYAASSDYEYYQETMKKAESLQTEINNDLNKVFLARMIKNTQADIDGFYNFTDMPYGKYYILASYQVFDNNVDWLLPVEINNKNIKIDLTNNNSAEIFIHFKKS